MKGLKLVLWIVVLVLFNVNSAVAADGLVAHWKFDEGQGTIANDSSGNANTGTLVNGPIWTAGKNGQALSFDGIDDYVVISTSSSLGNLTNQISVELWVYPRATDGVRIGIVQSPWSGYWINIEFGNFSAGTISANLNGDTAQLNTWSHLAMTYDGSMVRFYVNGVQKNSGSSTANMSVGNNVYIGSQDGTQRFWSGIIDEVRIWDRALPSHEILYHYQGISNKPYVIFLREEIKKVAHEWQKYKDRLNVNKESPFYSEARLLSEKWEKMLRIAKNLETIPIEELSDALKIAPPLLKETEELTTKIGMESLF